MRNILCRITYGNTCKNMLRNTEKEEMVLAMESQIQNGISRTLSARYHKDGSEILLEQKGKNPRRLTP